MYWERPKAYGRILMRGSFCAVLFALLAWPALAADPVVSPSPGSQLSVQERGIDKAADRDLSPTAQARLLNLEQLAGQPAYQVPKYQALLLMRRCVIVAKENQPDVLARLEKQLAALADSSGDKQIAITHWYCQQAIEDMSAGNNLGFELSYRAFAGVDSIDMASLKFLVALNYAVVASRVGFLDEAMKGANLALQIAQANTDPDREALSLARLALIQAQLGSYNDALKNNDEALRLTKSGMNTTDRLLNRGYMLISAKRYDEALTTYRKADALSTQQGYLEGQVIARTNISNIFEETGQIRANLDLTEQLMAITNSAGVEYLSAYAKRERAFALMHVGDSKQAIALFDSSMAWFERSEEYDQLAGGLRSWAELLAKQGMPREAYRALEKSVALDEKMQRATRDRNALFLSKALELNQKNLAIEELARKNKIDELQIEKKRLTDMIWLMVAIAVLALSLTLLLAYLKLRKSSRLLAKVNDELDYESTHDTLTGVFNRHYFNKFFTQRLKMPLGRALLLLLDIDHFKKVNDQYGHSIGDLVLQEVSRRLAGCLRSSDWIVRWGGEEFLIYIDNPSQGESIPKLVQRLLTVVSEDMVRGDGFALPIAVSIGFVEVSLSSATDLDAELAKIDQFLYQSKHAGRGRATGMLFDYREALTVLAA